MCVIAGAVSKWRAKSLFTWFQCMKRIGPSLHSCLMLMLKLLLLTSRHFCAVQSSVIGRDGWPRGLPGSGSRVRSHPNDPYVSINESLATISSIIITISRYANSKYCNNNESGLVYQIVCDYLPLWMLLLSLVRVLLTNFPLHCYRIIYSWSMLFTVITQLMYYSIFFVR